MSRKEQVILSKLLDCEIEDLSILKNIKYDISEIYDSAKSFFTYVDLGSIVVASYQKALKEIEDNIQKRIKELRLEDELSDLAERFSDLNPNRDFELRYHGADSFVTCKYNQSMYKLCPNYINEFTEKAGLKVTGLE